MKNQNLTFQALFQRYFATFSLQGRIGQIFSSTNVGNNIIKYNWSTSNTSGLQKTIIDFQNKLYKYQNNYELEREVAQKFSKSEGASDTSEEVVSYRNQLSLNKLRVKIKDTMQYNLESNYNFLGIYHYLEAGLGTKVLRTNFFGLSDTDRLGHLLISGNAGFGKDVLMKNMFLQDVQNGLGSVWISSDREDCSEVLAKIPAQRANDIIYLKPNDDRFTFGLDIFDGQNENSIIETVIEIFQNIWQGESTDKISYFLEPILGVILRNKDKVGISGYQRVINDFDYRNDLLANVKDRKVLEFWNNYKKSDQADMQSTLIKLESINRNQTIRDVIDNTVKNIKISEVMNQGKILILDLSELPDGNISARFMGNIILKKVAQLCNERSRENNKLFTVYADEYSSYSGADMFPKVSNLRKNNVSIVFSQTGTYDKKEKMEVGAICFGSFVNKVTFNTSDPYSKFVNHDEDLDLDGLIKNFPKLTCLFEGVINGFPLNPILLDIIENMFEAESDNINFVNNLSHFTEVTYSDSTKNYLSKPAKDGPTKDGKYNKDNKDYKKPNLAPTSQALKPTPSNTPAASPERSKSTQPPSDRSKETKGQLGQPEIQTENGQVDYDTLSDSELRKAIVELENSIKFDSEGKKRKNKLNTVRRKAIETKIGLIKTVLGSR